MSDPFVPFFSGPQRETRAESSFDVLVIPQTRSDDPSLGSPVTPGSTPANPGIAPSSHLRGCGDGSARPEPEITLDREGDRIVRITVRCGCGQVVELNCTY